jgi:hypothetical protein
MYIPMLNEVYVPLGETVTATAISTLSPFPNYLPL